MYKLSDNAFESYCSHLSFTYCVSLEEGVSWHSDQNGSWLNKNTQLRTFLLRYKMIVTIMATTETIFHSVHKICFRRVRNAKVL